VLGAQVTRDIYEHRRQGPPSREPNRGTATNICSEIRTARLLRGERRGRNLARRGTAQSVLALGPRRPLSARGRGCLRRPDRHLALGRFTGSAPLRTRSSTPTSAMACRPEPSPRREEGPSVYCCARRYRRRSTWKTWLWKPTPTLTGGAYSVITTQARKWSTGAIPPCLVPAPCSRISRACVVTWLSTSARIKTRSPNRAGQDQRRRDRLQRWRSMP
jgi:hypothetical protein